MKLENYLQNVTTFYSKNKEGIYNDYLDTNTHKRKDIPYELFVIAICDSGKKPYAKDMYNWVGENYDLLKDSIAPNGLLIADNVWWNGKVSEPAAKHDATTKAVIAYCEKIKSNADFESTLLPVRDGLLLSRKKA